MKLALEIIIVVVVLIWIVLITYKWSEHGYIRKAQLSIVKADYVYALKCKRFAYNFIPFWKTIIVTPVYDTYTKEIPTFVLKLKKINSVGWEIVNYNDVCDEEDITLQGLKLSRNNKLIYDPFLLTVMNKFGKKCFLQLDMGYLYFY